MSLELPAASRRQSRRWTSLAKALIIPGRGQSIDCVTVNWGEGGALLEVNGHDPLDTFNLLIGDRDLLVSCAVAHRSQTKIGVQFVGNLMRASRFGAIQSPRGPNPASGMVLGRSPFSLDNRRRS